MNMLKHSALLFLLLLGFAACDEDITEDPCAHEYDQEALLQNVGNNLIMPYYNSLQQEVDALKTATDAFVANPTETLLSDLQEVWLSANIAYQKASIFQFGPAEEVLLRENLNSFPVFTARLEDAVSSGTYDLSTPQFQFTKGFAGLDYLLHGLASDNSGIVVFYSSDADAANRKQFLTDVVNDIKSLVDGVVAEWNNGYLQTFISTTGVATGQPMSLLINQLNNHYELFKNDKLELPSGAATAGIADPTKVEALYSRKSLDLALAAIEASKAVFLGMANGNNGQGLDDYLLAANAMRDGLPLSQVIEEQYDKAIEALEGLQPSSLYDTIVNNQSDVEAAFAFAQNQVRFLKTDMPSVLCVNITYIDSTDDSD